MKSNEESILNTVSLWNADAVIPLLTGLRIAPGTAEFVQTSDKPSSSYTEDHNPSGIPLYQPSFPNSPKALKCSHCAIALSSRDEQIRHYKEKWHHFNLKRALEGLPSVTYDQYVNKSWQIQNDREDSSDNGSSEDESSDEEEELPIHRRPRVYFINVDDELISVYRNVILHRKTEIFSQSELISRASMLRYKLHWIVILVGGGHFSGAVFKGADVVVHKTFHSYSVRAKQGGSQSSRDNKSATSHPKSAGASLRRYNELSHNQHVQELISEWKDHIAECDLIFFRCPKRNNHLLFAKENPILSKTDSRLRTIPFPTKKPNFNEVKRVHHNLSLIFIHGKSEDHLDELNPLKTNKEDSPVKKKVLHSPRSNIKEKSPQKLSKSEISDFNTQNIYTESQSEDSDCVVDLTSSFETLGTGNLKSYGSWTPLRKTHKKVIHNKETTSGDPILKNSKSNESTEIDYPISVRQIRNFVYTATRIGSISQLEAVYDFIKEKDLTCVPELLPSHIIDAIMELDEDFDLFSLRFGTKHKSMLHIAAENAHKNLIWWLLDRGCDPTALDVNGATPYTATSVRVAKLQFRRYMAQFPHKFDYEKAKIPSPLTEEQENQAKQKLLEKKKRQKRCKNEKNKKEKELEKQRIKEKEEQERFLKLSDREKRALAAEKRMNDSQETSSSSAVNRCFLCAKEMSGIIPFEYLHFRFCSTSCVREHRKTN